MKYDLSLHCESLIVINVYCTAQKCVKKCEACCNVRLIAVQKTAHLKDVMYCVKALAFASV